MKIQTFILLGLLLVVAQGKLLSWAGNWDISPTKSDAACYPDTSILIEQTIGRITVSWVWDKTQACIDEGVAGKGFTATVDTPKDNSIDLKFTIKNVQVTGTFAITHEDEAVFVGNNKASATCSRRREFIYWNGIWDIVSQDDNACNPDKSVELWLDDSFFYVYARWVWADSAACRKLNLVGTQAWTRSDYTERGDVIVSFEYGSSAKVEGMFAINHNQVIFFNPTGAPVTFSRRQELVNWVGTWDIVKTGRAEFCYPDGQVTIIPSGSNLTASWTWQMSDFCASVGLAGKSFTQSLSVPKGKALPLNFIAGGAYVSGVVIIDKNEDEAVFLSTVQGDALFKRRSQMVNWAGAWEITTQPQTSCYPESAITVAQNSTDITLSWIWARTSPCTTLDLAGKKFNKTINTPEKNSVQLDISTTLSVLFTVFHDRAVFSTNGVIGGASTFNRKDENVKFAGIWNIQSQQAGSGCFPDTSIIITQDGGSITAKWTWADSDHCRGAGLAGIGFTMTEPTPKGRAMFIDFLAKTVRVSGIFTVNGDQAIFASNTGASATFNRKSSTEPSKEPVEEPSKEPSKEPSTDPKNGSSSTGIIAIILIVVLAIGAYFYIQKTRGKKVQEDLNVSLSDIYARH
jgi:hypothetical protein